MPVLAFVDGSFPRHGSSYQQWPDSLSLHFYDDFVPVELYLLHEGGKIPLTQWWVIHHDLLLLGQEDWLVGQFQWYWRVMSGFDQQHRGGVQFAIGESYQGPRLAETQSSTWQLANAFQWVQFVSLLLFALVLSGVLSKFDLFKFGRFKFRQTNFQQINFGQMQHWLLFFWLVGNLTFLAAYLTWLLSWPIEQWWTSALIWQNTWLQTQLALLACTSMALLIYHRLAGKLLAALAYGLALLAWQPWPQNETPHVHDSKAFSFDAVRLQSEPWQRVLPSMPWQFFVRLQDIRAEHASQLWVTLYDQQARVVVPDALWLRLSSAEQDLPPIAGELIRDDFLFRLPSLAAGEWQWHIETDWPEGIEFQWLIELK